MPGSWVSDQFPEFKDAVHHLVAQHRELTDEPLHLAVTYLASEREPQHVYLFEVVSTPGASLNPERDLFEATFGSAASFSLLADHELHLILTNPRELEVALDQGWPLANEVETAIRSGNYQILYQDETGQTAMVRLEAQANLQAVGRG